MINVEGRLQYDPKRGVVYFFAEKSKECLLRIEGVPALPIDQGTQIDIHLVNEGGEHHHVHPRLGLGDGSICAVKLTPRK